ncbi:MAG: MATE family efflux transporter [Bacteroidetes bacterium GWF2_49_14]|nr:MAG: MATE family efflux transporter [Bacteroidetes bacterium GWF2_49_14]HBB92264.1 MATE family efflux transporter [Bacteroidales bacterium]
MKYFLNFKQLRKDVWESISGTEMDFTAGSMGRAVFLLSIPMVLEMVMESIFAIVDIFFVSKLGSEAIATVGITESLITIVYAIGGGLAMATTALVARRTGEKRPEEASRVAFQAILTGVLVSTLIAVPGFLWSSDLLRLMGGSEEMQGELASYTKIMLGSNGVIIILFIINSVLRSSGDAAMSLRVLITANFINIILDPLLIFGIGPFPELGIKGAAIATLIGRSVGVSYQVFLLFRGKRRIKLTLADIRFEPHTIWQIIKLSLGGIGQSLIATTSWIGLVRIIATFGSSVVAGYTIAIRVIIFALLPSAGISNAAATLVGQNLGADKPERAERSVWLTAKVNLVLMGLLGLVLAIFPEFFIRMFIQDPAVIVPAVQALRIISFGFAFYGLGMVMIQALNGAGDTATPTKVFFICFWLIEIPLAWVLAKPLNTGPPGVFISIVVAETIMTLISFYLFRRGKWKLKKV